jgi:hypothetical protein
MSVDGGLSWSGWLIANGPFFEPSRINPEAVANAYGGWTYAGVNYASGAVAGDLVVCSHTE